MTIDWKARAEAAEARANSFYRTFLETIRAFGGVAEDGLSDAFIQLGVPAEAAAVVKRMKAAEARAKSLRDTLLEIIIDLGAVPGDGMSDNAVQSRALSMLEVAIKRKNTAEAERDALASQNEELRAALEGLREEVSAGCHPDAPVEELKDGIHFEPVVEADRVLALTPPAALEALRRRERSIGAEEELRQIDALIEYVARLEGGFQKILDTLDEGDSMSWYQLEAVFAEILATSPLSGQPQPAPTTGWRPIAEAPRDGKEIIVCKRVLDADNFHIFCHVAAWWAEENNGNGAWIIYNNMVRDPELHYDPTHWMPLPAPPKEGE